MVKYEWRDGAERLMAHLSLAHLKTAYNFFRGAASLSGSIPQQKK